ncbi:AFG1-like ATPase-domain-containing protein [Chytriomyces sp. MP71]|nr:AFG1-like ATPase-domain-containing protein [Chytriomyces sp. MP71]
MLMRRLFTTLFSFSHTKSPTIPAFTLVTTSNKPIAELYGTGINRQQVKPLLHALETHCETIVMDHSTDYRKLHAQSATTRCFYHPGPTSDYATQQEAHTAFMNRFMTECGETPPQPTRVSLAAGRTLDVPLASPRCAWVPFDLLCGNRGKLGGADYLALCARFPRIFVSGPVPLLDKDGFGDGGVKGVDLGRRFINLVDVAYDSRVGLVVEAVADVESVLRGLREAPNVAPFFQGGGEGEIRVKKEGGSSSSSSTTYVGQMEWSATGLQDASLASIGNVGVTETSFAVDRAASRLIEMGTLVWANK